MFIKLVKKKVSRYDLIPSLSPWRFSVCPVIEGPHRQRFRRSQTSVTYCCRPRLITGIICRTLDRLDLHLQIAILSYSKISLYMNISQTHLSMLCPIPSRKFLSPKLVIFLLMILCGESNRTVEETVLCSSMSHHRVDDVCTPV